MIDLSKSNVLQIKHQPILSVTPFDEMYLKSTDHIIKLKTHSSQISTRREIPLLKTNKRTQSQHETQTHFRQHILVKYEFNGFICQKTNRHGSGFWEDWWQIVAILCLLACCTISAWFNFPIPHGVCAKKTLNAFKLSTFCRRKSY